MNEVIYCLYVVDDKWSNIKTKCIRMYVLLLDHSEWHIYMVYRSHIIIPFQIIRNFEKRLKNSWIQRHFSGGICKKLLNLPIIIKIDENYYRISYTKYQGFEKNMTFLQIPALKCLQIHEFFIVSQNSGCFGKV